MRIIASECELNLMDKRATQSVDCRNHFWRRALQLLPEMLTFHNVRKVYMETYLDHACKWTFTDLSIRWSVICTDHSLRYLYCRSVRGGRGLIQQLISPNTLNPFGMWWSTRYSWTCSLVDMLHGPWPFKQIIPKYNFIDLLLFLPPRPSMRKYIIFFH